MPSKRFEETKLRTTSKIYLNEYQCEKCLTEFAFTLDPAGTAGAVGGKVDKFVPVPPQFCPNCGRRVGTVTIDSTQALPKLKKENI